MSAPRDDMPVTRFARPVVVGPFTAAGGQPVAGNGLITGWSFREMTGAASAVVEIFDGNDANGTLVATIGLAASESTRDLMSRYGIECRTGIFVNVVAGTVKGSIWVVDLS